MSRRRAMQKDVRNLLLVLIASFGLLFAGTTSALAANPHEVPKDPIECTTNGTTVTCSGSVAGLGNEVVFAVVDADFACETRSGSNQPPGHVQGKSGPIQPRNGRITFSVTTGPASCPRGLNPTIGDFATVTLIDAQGDVLFTKRVRITPA
jgi:hypothetical protein